MPHVTTLHLLPSTESSACYLWQIIYWRGAGWLTASTGGWRTRLRKQHLGIPGRTGSQPRASNTRSPDRNCLQPPTGSFWPRAAEEKTTKGKHYCTPSTVLPQGSSEWEKREMNSISKGKMLSTSHIPSPAGRHLRSHPPRYRQHPLKPLSFQPEATSYMHKAAQKQVHTNPTQSSHTRAEKA